jgi:hypothetical protein
MKVDDLDELASDQEPDDAKSGIRGGSCWACSLADAIHTALRDNWSRNVAMVIASRPDTRPLEKVNGCGSVLKMRSRHARALRKFIFPFG